MDTKTQFLAFAEFLESFVSEHKQSRMKHVLSHRTEHITVVCEDIYQGHNTSAILRNCDCFGIQNIHVIERAHDFRPDSEITMGAAKWISLEKHVDTKTCVANLKDRGYKIAATSLREPNISVYDLPIDQPLALFFGTEKEGLSDEAHESADYFVHIPMFGFSQSYNVSVSAALTLSELTRRMHDDDEHIDWHIPDKKQREITTYWYYKSVQHAPALLRRFCENQKISPKYLESLFLSD